MFKGTLGCKTGVTKSAGACFSGCFSRAKGKDNERRDNVIVVVLGCSTM